MAGDVVSVRLWLWRIEVLGVVVDAPGRLMVGVRSTVCRPECPRCTAAGGKVRDRRDDRVRDLGISGRPVVLVWERRRLVCEPCASRFAEGRPVFEGRVTARPARRLVADDRRRSRRCRVLLAGETSIRKRHRCVTVLADGDTGEVLAMVPHRNTGALSGFLAAHPRLKLAWDALGELHQLYLAGDRDGAMAALDRFADIYRTGQIPEFSDTVDTFLAWHEQILDWHRAGRPNNARIDRTNNLHPSPAPPGPRLHQLRQHRSPRPATNLTPPSPAARIPTKDEGSEKPVPEF
ncbi:transposase [Candidatus Poriferisodalis sp.]|uniref:transposase n=1 Tax=Candidatus Poriferisodalis sp. TaxID=3101277 RepID=UPI003C6ECF30